MADFSGEIEFMGYRFRYDTVGATICYTAIGSVPTAILDSLRDSVNRTADDIRQGIREMDGSMLHLGLARQTTLGVPVSPLAWPSSREWPRDEQGRYLITDERAEAEWRAWQAEMTARICAIFGVSPDALTPSQNEGIARLLSDVDARYAEE